MNCFCRVSWGMNGMSIRETWGGRLILQISGMAFLALVTSGRKSSLLGCAIAAIATGIFFLKRNITLGEMKRHLRVKYVIPGLFLCGMTGGCFFDRWTACDKVKPIADFLGAEPEILIAACAVMGILAATPIVAACLSFYVEMAARDYHAARQNGSDNNIRKVPMARALVILAMIYILGISAILRANINYIDDMGRIANGYKGWEDYSRFLSVSLSSFLHMDNYLTDISPLPQLLAVLILAVAGITLLYVFYNRTCFTGCELIALVPLGLNPYFLQCISYKFDSPYMALSVLGSVIPFLYKNKRSGIYVGASVIGMLIVCTTYQAASGIYPMFVILQAFKMWSGQESLKETGRFCLRSVIGWGAGLAFYNLIIMVPRDGGYASSHLAGIEHLISSTFGNLARYYQYVKEDFKTCWLALVFLLILGFMWTAVKSSRKNVLITMMMAAVCLALNGLVCFGVYPALEKQSMSPRAMYCVGVLITFLGIYVAEKKGNLLFKVSSFVLSWAFFVFSLTYGNALKIQKDYTDFRIQMVLEELNEMDVFQEEQPVIVQIAGTIGQSPILKNMPQNYSMLNRLVQVTFRQNWRWGTIEFYSYYGLKNVIHDSQIDLKTYDLPVLMEKMYYTIRARDNYVLVELK